MMKKKTKKELKLLIQMKDLDEIEDVGRVLDPNPPEKNKAMGGFLVGLLTEYGKSGKY